MGPHAPPWNPRRLAADADGVGPQSSRCGEARRVADDHSEVNAEAAIREIMDRETRAWNTADVPLC
jgi:hypothetical protein